MNFIVEMCSLAYFVSFSSSPVSCISADVDFLHLNLQNSPCLYFILFFYFLENGITFHTHCFVNIVESFICETFIPPRSRNWTIAERAQTFILEIIVEAVQYFDCSNQMPEKQCCCCSVFPLVSVLPLCCWFRLFSALFPPLFFGGGGCCLFLFLLLSLFVFFLFFWFCCVSFALCFVGQLGLIFEVWHLHSAYHAKVMVSDCVQMSKW